MKRLILILTLALLGCGESNTGSNGTGSLPTLTVASGPVTSVDPAEIAGARMDVTGAQALVGLTSGLSGTDLQVGMVADVDGSVTPDSNSGSATSVVAQSLVKGWVTSVDPARQRFQVMGIPVVVDRNTVCTGFCIPDSFPSLGELVEVYGLRLPGTEGILATRLGISFPLGLGPPYPPVEVLGTIGEIGTASLTTQGLRVDLAQATVGTSTPAGFQPSLPGAVSPLTAGAVVRVIGTYDERTGTVSAIAVTVPPAPSRPEGKQVYLEAFVMEGSGRRFTVGDLAVDTTDVELQLAVGMRVKLRGRMQAGVLRVDRATVE